MSSIFIIAALVIVFGAFMGVTRGKPVLALKEFSLNEHEDEFLKITGRAPGIFGWVLSSCGFDPVTSLRCNRKLLKFEEAAIRSGKRTLSIPLVAVTGVSAGITKPFGLLVVGILVVLGGIAGAVSLPYYEEGAKAVAFFMGLIIGAIFIVLYVLNKDMTFQIYSGGDKPIAAICVKKSVIEGQNIDEHKFGAAADALNKAVWGIHVILARTKAQSG
jgi:hypothetical protein